MTTSNASLFDSLLLKLNIPTEKVKQQKVVEASINLEQALSRSETQCRQLHSRLALLNQNRQTYMTDIINKKRLFANRPIPKNIESQMIQAAKNVEQIDQEKRKVEIQIDILQKNISRIRDQQSEREIQKNIEAMKNANVLVNSAMPGNGGLSDLIDDTLEGDGEENEKAQLYNEYSESQTQKIKLNEQTNPVLSDIMSEADAMMTIEETYPNIGTLYQPSSSNVNMTKPQNQQPSQVESEQEADASYFSLLETLTTAPKTPGGIPKRVYKQPISIVTQQNKY